MNFKFHSSFGTRGRQGKVDLFDKTIAPLCYPDKKERHFRTYVYICKGIQILNGKSHKWAEKTRSCLLLLKLYCLFAYRIYVTQPQILYLSLVIYNSSQDHECKCSLLIKSCSICSYLKLLSFFCLWNKNPQNAVLWFNA